MSLHLPPPPPRHPSSRAVPRSPSPPRPLASPRLASQPHAAAERPSGEVDVVQSGNLAAQATHRNHPVLDPRAEASRSTASLTSHHDALPPSAGSPSPPIEPPPRHPYVEERNVDETTRKLAELEDLEIAEMLDRVGGRLVALEVAPNEPRGDVEYPSISAFRDESGHVDYATYLIAYATVLISAYTPPSLVGTPPRDEFSLRALRDDLSRLYVLCPPSTWQGFLLGDLARLYRWEDPLKTGKAAAVYLVLWTLNLLPVFPVGVLIYYILRPRLFPPSPAELLAESTERSVRTREAAELSKQLKNSSAGRGVGFAVEGVRGVLSDLKDRVPLGRSASDKNLAAALGSTALVGGSAGGGGAYSNSIRQRLGRAGSPEGASTEKRTGPGSPGTDDEPRHDDEPARDRTGDVSLYRLVRNLVGSFGPPVQTILGDAIDLLEMIRNVIQHPDHPASLPVLLRLVFVFFVILATPTWLRLKTAFAYAGVEFFVLWKLREMYPEWRRATIFYWWIFAGAPTDAEYAVYVLNKRGKEGRPISGSKTIKRMARSRASSSVEPRSDRSRAMHRIAKSVSDTASIMSSSSTSSVPDKPASTFFALHRSVPGQLVLTSTSIRFVPARRLRKLGFHKIVARVAKNWDPSISLEQADDQLDARDGDESVGDSVYDDASSISNARSEVKQVEIELPVEEVAKVKKARHFRLPALEITSRDGKSYAFTNVARRDDCFNKILSSSSIPFGRA
ncbi:hypothetical protein JCM10212_005623 [Sporobolomyces blumeae]